MSNRINPRAIVWQEPVVSLAPPDFDPLIAALAQLVRDRWAREGVFDNTVVAMRPHKSERPTVSTHKAGRQDGAG